jgi:hypothetical protein
MMFWILITLLMLYIMPCPTTAMETSDKILGQMIKVQCKDTKEGKEGEYYIDYLQYSTTIKNMLEDFANSSGPVSVNTSHETFTCLMQHFVRRSYEADNHFDDARTKFRELKLQCPNNTPLDLLIQANYLDITIPIFDDKWHRNIPFMDLMASLYADHLQTQPFHIIEEGGATLCDGLPRELEPLVAGWLLYDLCKDTKPTTVHKKFKFSGDLDNGPILSNIGSKNGFACVWSQIGGGSSQSDMLSHRYVYFDFLQNGPFQQKILSSSPFKQEDQDISIQQCALSEDGNYMLIVGGTETRSKAYLYNLSNSDIDPKNHGIIPVHSETIEHSIDDIITTLFDGITGNFNIIAQSPIVQGNVETKTTFHYYNFSPHSESLQLDGTADCPTTFDCNGMQWSCINGKLIGVCQSKQPEDMRAVVRDKNTLIECFFDAKNQQWYTAKGDKQGLKFQVINSPIDRIVFAEFRKIAVQDYFIPHFQHCLSYSMIPPVLVRRLRLDSTHLCTYCISYPSLWGGQEVGILYPFGQKLTMAINILNKRVSSQQKQVLVDAFFLDRFHRKPKSWELECEKILKPMLLSKEIQELYNVDQLLEIKKITSLGWIQAWKQKKFWSYVQQRWQSFYHQYKKPLWSSLALGGTGLAAWYLSKYGKTIRFSWPEQRGPT